MSNAIQLSIMYSTLAIALKDRDTFSNEYHDAVKSAKEFASIAESEIVKPIASNVPTRKHLTQEEFVKNAMEKVKPVNNTLIGVMSIWSMDDLDKSTLNKTGNRLQPRIKKLLEENGYPLVSDLLRSNYGMLMKVKGLGGSSYHHINRILAIHGMRIGMWVKPLSLPANIRPMLHVDIDDIPRVFAKAIYNKDTPGRSLPIRIRNSLNASGVVKLQDLLSKNVDDLRHFPNFGEKSVKEVIDWLASMGLTMGVTDFGNVLT